MIDLNELRNFVFKSRMDPFHWDLSRSIETEHINARGGDEADGVIDHQVDDGDELQPITLTNTDPNVNRKDREQSEEADESGDGDRGADKSERDAVAPTNMVDYQPGSFVVVQNSSTEYEISHSGSSGKDFWVAKVMDSTKNGGSSYATSLKVHWYDHEKDDCQPRDLLAAKFHPCYQEPARKRRKYTPALTISRHKLQVPWTDVIHTDTVLVSFDGLTKRHTLPLSVQKKLSR